MAVMIPSNPKEFDPKSAEDDVFNALRNLPDDYYVFHSVSLLKVFREYEYRNITTREERQIDFVVFHAQKGIICIEAKNWSGIISYSNGTDDQEEGWYLNGLRYTNGRYDGPFEQAESFCRDFRERLRTSPNNLVVQAINSIKVLPAVWLIPKHENEILSMSLPMNVNRNSILSFEDLYDRNALREKIDSIFDTRICYNGVELTHFRRLSANESTALISAIAPNFVIPFEQYARERDRIVFNQLLKQQYAVLDFLREQKTAVISGVAGTGKTMLAIRKAEIHADEGDRVLYLCFNNELARQISADFQHNNVEYMTLDGYCHRLCGHDFTNDDKDAFYEECLRILEGTNPEDYSYMHVILDEGQDIRINPLIERILEEIKAIIELKEGTFYIFYDKMQLMPYTDRDHSGQLPKIITDADCKLTLYRNCRNTKKIAQSATVTVVPEPPTMMETAPDGTNPKIYYCNDDGSVRQKVETIIRDLVSREYERRNIVVLSLKGENGKMNLGGVMVNGVRYMSTNRFKGLDAEAVIIVDFDQSIFDSEENCKLYYVAASRAKEELHVVTAMTDADIARINRNVFKWYVQEVESWRQRQTRNPVPDITSKRTFENAMGFIRG